MSESKTTLEAIQTKHAHLDYLLKFLQIFVSIKKEFALITELEDEIKRLAQLELPEKKPTIDLRQG